MSVRIYTPNCKHLFSSTALVAGFCCACDAPVGICDISTIAFHVSGILILKQNSPTVPKLLPCCNHQLKNKIQSTKTLVGFQ